MGLSRHRYPQPGDSIVSFNARRAMVATIVAIASGAIGLAASLFTIGSGARSDLRPDGERMLSGGFSETLAYDFAALQSSAVPRSGAPDSLEGRTAPLSGDTATKNESTEGSQIVHNCKDPNWPYFDSSCAWGEEELRRHRRRITFRLRSPWCSSALRHQVFFSCRSRT